MYLMDQKLPLDVPRVRDVEADAEVSLAAYRALQTPKKTDEGLLLRVLKGISCRNYKACAESVPEAFGISASSVSRRFIKATAKKLKQFQERPLDDYGFVTLFIDGKSFADEEIVIAPGVTMDGQKIPLGFVESATENERICRQLIQDLIWRGLCYDQAFSLCSTAQRGSAVPSPKPSKGMCAFIAASGTSARMSSAISRRGNVRESDGSSRKPMTATPTRRQRPHSNHLNPN